MRLRRLDLTRYGGFEGATLDLPRPDGADVTVIIGPNEADKSTAFDAWLDLLYGFPTKSHPRAWRVERRELDVSAIVETGGQARVRRVGAWLVPARPRGLDYRALGLRADRRPQPRSTPDGPGRTSIAMPDETPQAVPGPETGAAGPRSGAAPGHAAGPAARAVPQRGSSPEARPGPSSEPEPPTGTVVRPSPGPQPSTTAAVRPDPSSGPERVMGGPERVMGAATPSRTGAPAGSGAGSATGAAAAFAAYRGTVHFGSLDGLRFFCILAVLWHHAPVWTAMADPGTLLQRGFLGVDFFFVLSGFLITTLLLREEARTGRFSLRGFYWRRILRIVPVYFFAVTLVVVYTVMLKGETRYAPLVPWYYLFLSNFLTADIPMLAPTWSLAVEEQYYMLWPLLLLVLPRRWILPALVLLVAVNVAGILGAFRTVGIHPVEAGVLRFALPNATYAPILIGSGIAILLHDPRGFAALWRVLSARAAPLVVAAALLAVIATTPPDVRGWPNLGIHLLMAASLVTLVVREDHMAAPLLGWRPLARVGEISYGIYLYHLMALAVVTKLLPGAPAPAVLVLYAALSALVAEISFRTLERYFRRFRHGIARAAPSRA